MAKGLFKYTVILLLVIPAFVYATSTVSAIKHTISNHREPTAHQLAQLAMLNLNDDLDSVLYYANLSFETSRKQNDRNGILEAWLVKARYYFYQKDNDKTWMYIDLIKQYAQEFKNDSILAETHFLCGETYWFKPNYRNSLMSFFKALTITDRINSKTLAAKILCNIGDIYYYLNQFEYALKYYNEAIIIAKGTTEELITISFCQSGVADIYRQQNNHEKSIDLYKQSLKLALQAKQIDIAAFNLWGLGANYMEINDYKQATYCLRESIALSEKIKGFYRIASCYIIYGKIHEHKSDFTKAHYYYYRSDSIAQKQGYPDLITESSNAKSKLLFKQQHFNRAIRQALITYKRAVKENNPPIQIEALTLLHKSSEETGDLKNAYTYKVRYIALADSLQKTANMEQTAQLQLKFELERRKTTTTIFTNTQPIVGNAIIYEKLLRNSALIGIACFFVCILSVYTYHYFKKGQQS